MKSSNLEPKLNPLNNTTCIKLDLHTKVIKLRYKIKDGTTKRWSMINWSRKTIVFLCNFTIKKWDCIIFFHFKSKFDVRMLTTQIFKKIFNMRCKSIKKIKTHGLQIFCRPCVYQPKLFMRTKTTNVGWSRSWWSNPINLLIILVIKWN